mmetsp:Transcript_42419/g.99608  ORF Transcript_42419/g.99608 Transcript_42419/m.99608 type:complete len:206 (-) Transcript_42419:122-739(-)
MFVLRTTAGTVPCNVDFGKREARIRCRSRVIRPRSLVPAYSTVPTSKYPLRPPPRQHHGVPQFVHEIHLGGSQEKNRQRRQPRRQSGRPQGPPQQDPRRENHRQDRRRGRPHPSAAQVRRLQRVTSGRRRPSPGPGRNGNGSAREAGSDQPIWPGSGSGSSSGSGFGSGGGGAILLDPCVYELGTWLTEHIDKFVQLRARCELAS